MDRIVFVLRVALESFGDINMLQYEFEENLPIWNVDFSWIIDIGEKSVKNNNIQKSASDHFMDGCSCHVFYASPH